MSHHNPDYMQAIKGYLFMQCHAVQCSMLNARKTKLDSQGLAIVLLFVLPEMILATPFSTYSNTLSLPATGRLSWSHLWTCSSFALRSRTTHHPNGW